MFRSLALHQQFDPNGRLSQILLADNSRSTPISRNTQVPRSKGTTPLAGSARHSCGGYIGHTSGSGVYADSTIGRAGSDSLARERRLADRKALVFLLSTRNDVLRVSAYMQPRDRAWQIGSARVCRMCIARRAHTYIGSSPSKVEDISRGVWSYLQRKWAFTTQPASNLKEYIYIHMYMSDIYIYISLCLFPVERDDSSRAAK